MCLSLAGYTGLVGSLAWRSGAFGGLVTISPSLVVAHRDTAGSCVLGKFISVANLSP